MSQLRGLVACFFGKFWYQFPKMTRNGFRSSNEVVNYRLRMPFLLPRSDKHFSAILNFTITEIKLEINHSLFENRLMKLFRGINFDQN